MGFASIVSKLGSGLKKKVKQNGGVKAGLQRLGQASPQGQLFSAVNKFRDWKSQRPKPTAPGSATTPAFGVTQPKQSFAPMDPVGGNPAHGPAGGFVPPAPGGQVDPRGGSTGGGPYGGIMGGQELKPQVPPPPLGTSGARGPAGGFMPPKLPPASGGLDIFGQPKQAPVFNNDLSGPYRTFGG